MELSGKSVPLEIVTIGVRGQVIKREKQVGQA
jgi:hypothetical protein